MKKIIVSLGLLVIIPAFAIECKEDGNQMQMNRCAYESFEKADKELNKVYKALVKKKKDNKVYVSNLKKSQRLWIKFRDAELETIYSCEDENKRLCWGSMYPLLYNSEKATLTRKRVEELKEQIKSHEAY